MVKKDLLIEALQRDLSDLTPAGWSAILRALPAVDTADARLTFKSPDGERTEFAVEIKSRLEPSQVALRPDSQKPTKNWLIVAPVIGSRTRELLDRGGTSWLEPGGDCRIVAGGLLVVRERRARKMAMSSPGASQTRFVRNIFGGAALRVVRWLLIEPDRAWTIADMSVAAKVTIGFVSRTFATLERDSYVVRRRGETRLINYDDLLDSWTEAAQPVQETFEGVSLAKPGEVLQVIADLGRSAYALTAEAAAEQLAPFARFSKVELYVQDFDRWRRDLKLTPVPVGANVRLIVSDDRGVFDGSHERHGLRLVSLPQLYVDLQRREGAGSEAAAFLRQRFDKLRRQIGPAKSRR